MILLPGAPRPVLTLGDDRLRRPATPAGPPPYEPALLADLAALLVTLDAFRATHGFGRGIAAPQIGLPLRAVALRIPRYGGLLLDPAITWRSEETFELWDDCMSFPDLLVRVRRHSSITVRFFDLEGAEHTWERLDPAASELLQHELDHLDGVLALDRAIGPDAIRPR